MFINDLLAPKVYYENFAYLHFRPFSATSGSGTDGPCCHMLCVKQTMRHTNCVCKELTRPYMKNGDVIGA